MLNIPDYVTVRLPFHVVDREAFLILSTAWLTKVCAHRLLNDVKLNTELLKYSQYSFLQYARDRCYEILPNRRYVDGIAVLIHSTLKSVKALGINIQDVELKHWLLFQSEAERGKYVYGNKNIKLLKDFKVEVLTFDYKHRSYRIILRPKIPKGYSKLLKTLVDKAFNGEIGYHARIYVENYGMDSDGNFHLYGEVQINVPYALYLEVMKRYDKPLSDNVAGIDVNTDRLNVAVLSIGGRILTYKTFWFEDASRKGCPRERAWSIIGEKIHEALKWCYFNGVSTIFLEDYKIIGYLKWLWIKEGERKCKNWNYKVHIFRSSIIERIIWKSILYGFNVKLIDPKGTTHSELHDSIMKKYGVDRHTASAIVIAMKGLKQT